MQKAKVKEKQPEWYTQILLRLCKGDVILSKINPPQEKYWNKGIAKEASAVNGMKSGCASLQCRFFLKSAENSLEVAKS